MDEVGGGSGVAGGSCEGGEQGSINTSLALIFLLLLWNG